MKKKHRKPIYRPTAADMTAAAARHICRKRPHLSLEDAYEYLEASCQAEMARLRCESEADPLPKPSGRVIAFPARRLVKK